MFYKNKKFHILSLSILALLGLGFGCKGLSTEQQAAVKPVKLNYWTVYNDVGELKRMAAEFQKIRPYVSVNIRQVRADEFDKLFVNALADDVPPDIISISNREVRKYENRLSPMPSSVTVSNVSVQGKYFKETVVTQTKIALPTVLDVKNNYVSAVYDDAVIGDKVYGLPLAFDTMALYYNKDLLDQSGIPEPPKTWEEFMAAVKAGRRFDKDKNIIQAGAALGTGNNIARASDILSLLMLQSGVTMSRGSYITFASGIDKAKENHPTLSALRFYTDFAREDKDVYTWNEKMGDALTEFARGKVIFYFGYAYDYPRIRAMAPQLNLEVIPMPQLNKDKPVNIANYSLEAVVAKSKHINEAWDFLNFITMASNVEKYTAAAKRPTPLRSQITKQKEDPILAPFMAQILQAENWYRGRDIATAEKAMQDMIHSYLFPVEDERKSPEEQAVEAVIYAAKVIQQTM